ncbi:MAG: hypothetical protein ACREU4_03615, partial [Burkholderiales bacterium]
LWRALGFGEDVLAAPWPEPDAAALERDAVEYVVQVNGKTRGSICVPRAADQKTIETSAVAAMAEYVANQVVKRIVIVPGRLVNIVV